MLLKAGCTSSPTLYVAIATMKTSFKLTTMVPNITDVIGYKSYISKYKHHVTNEIIELSVNKLNQN
jgi:hypothetical protein